MLETVAENFCIKKSDFVLTLSDKYYIIIVYGFLKN